MEAAARAIDRHLMDRHIGAYEMVSFYHSRASSFSPAQGARLFRKAIGTELGVALSAQYCRDLVTYYDSL